MCYSPRMGKHWPYRHNPRGLWEKGTRAEELPDLFADPVLGPGRRAWFRSYLVRVGECDEWMGARQNRFQASGQPLDYGLVNIGGKSFATHRVAYAMHYKISPGELQVCHACDNPPCQRKAHLFLGTQADNNADMKRKGRLRSVRGELMPTAKLTEANVKRIWKLHARGWGYNRLAKEFGVARNTIQYVLYGRSWTHVELPKELEELRQAALVTPRPWNSRPTNF